jgi:hypothetical protein
MLLFIQFIGLLISYIETGTIALLYCFSVPLMHRPLLISSHFHVTEIKILLTKIISEYPDHIRSICGLHGRKIYRSRQPRLKIIFMKENHNTMTKQNKNILFWLVNHNKVLFCCSSSIKSTLDSYKVPQDGKH